MNFYDSNDIKVFKGLDAVRKRPGMYIGNTDDGSGLHKMVFEAVDNSIDEFLSGFCTSIDIILKNDGYVTIIDNGRGMPVDFHKEENMSSVEVIMTILHSGAKFDNSSYKISGGLHGVGISVVNALSIKLILKIFRNNNIYEQCYEYGKPVTDLLIVGTTFYTGTEISFLPDFDIFKQVKFDYNFLVERFRELSFLNSGIKINLFDERKKNNKNDLFLEYGGITSFITFLNKDDKVINKDPIFFSDIKDDIVVNCSLQWIDSSKEIILCYTNNIFQRDGGSHLIGFKSALTRAFKIYLDSFIQKENDLLILGDDIRDGLISVLSVYMQNPKFSSQVKDKLISLEAKQVVESIVFSKLKDYFYDNPVVLKVLASKIISAAKAREAAKKAKDLVKKKNSLSFLNLHGKLSDCQEKNPKFSELFLVEGDSAGGSAKQARDRRTQAILPLKGKILNVERSGFDKIFSSSELKSVLSALRCTDNNDISNLKYHKIIFMTDADIDGAHIKTLLLTFFYRKLPALIYNCHIFVANPPLYKVSINHDEFYFKDKLDFDNFLFIKMCNYLEKLGLLLHGLDNLLLKYLKVQSIIDKLSINFPRLFFERLIYFNIRLDLSNLDFFIKNLLSYEKFLNMKNNNNVYFKFISFFNTYCYVNFFLNGVYKKFKLNFDFFNSQDYFLIYDFYLCLSDFFNNNRIINIDGINYNFYSFKDLINYVYNKVVSKFVIQRYKGLGEMNPIQLWDTTMDPSKRALSMIKIKDAIEAHNIFSNLMGDNIESRKNFIEINANFSLDLDI